MTSEILNFNPTLHNEVIELIVNIQQREYNLSLTLADQPDLKDILNSYECFFVARYDDKIIGTLGLIKIEDFGVMRKLFVHKDFRKKGIAQELLSKIEDYCFLHNISKLYLGTVDVLKEAHRFFEKNQFIEIKPEDLPKEFPRMKVETNFYFKKLF